MKLIVLRFLWILAIVLPCHATHAISPEGRAVAEDVLAVFGRENLPDQNDSFAEQMAIAAQHTAIRRDITIEVVKDHLRRFVREALEKGSDSYDQAMAFFLLDRRVEGRTVIVDEIQKIEFEVNDGQLPSTAAVDRLGRFYHLLAVNEWLREEFRQAEILFRKAHLLCAIVGKPGDSIELEWKIMIHATRRKAYSAGRAEWTRFRNRMVDARKPAFECALAGGWLSIVECGERESEGAPGRLEEFLLLRRKLIPEPDFCTVNWLSWIAGCYGALGAPERALPHGLEALRLAEKLSPNDSARVKPACLRVARIYAALGDFKTADRFYGRWIDAHDKGYQIIGELRAQVLSEREGLQSAITSQPGGGSETGSITRARRIAPTWEPPYRPDGSPPIPNNGEIEPWIQLAELKKLGVLQRAEQVFAERLRRVTADSPGEARVIWDAKLNVGCIQAAQGKYKEARAMLVPSFQNYISKIDWEFLNILFDFDRFLVAIRVGGDDSEANRLIEEMVAFVRNQHPEHLIIPMLEERLLRKVVK